MFDIVPITSPKHNDCGPTCLKMLLAYYGQDVALDQLIKDCNVKLNGCSAKDINQAGRKYGLDMKSFKMDAEELVNQDRPAIVWWQYQHFCIFAGKDEDGKVVICNPDRGRYRMSLDTFKSFYTEVSLWNGEPHDL